MVGDVGLPRKCVAFHDKCKHVLLFHWSGPNHRNVKSRSHKHKNMTDYRRNIAFIVFTNELYSSLNIEEQCYAPLCYCRKRSRIPECQTDENTQTVLNILSYWTQTTEIRHRSRRGRPFSRQLAVAMRPIANFLTVATGLATSPCSAVLIEHRLVTDGQTDRQTRGHS